MQATRCMGNGPHTHTAAWKKWLAACKPHIAAGNLHGSFKLFEEVWRGQSAYAQSLNLGTNTDMFRRAVYEVVREQVVCRHGRASLEAEAYKAHMQLLVLSARG